MILDHNISVGTESPTNEPTCTVNLRISQLLCTALIDILETEEGKMELNYDAEHHVPSFFRTFSFSFDELRHSPWMCTTRLRGQLARILPAMDFTTRKKVVDKIVGNAAQLAYLRDREGNFNIGYIFDATLELVHFQLSCIETGRYERGDGEEVMTCSVCLDSLEVGKEFSKLPCSHVFHTSCVDPWLERNNTCPNCRNELVYKDDTEEMLVEYLRQNAAAGRFPGA